MTIKEVLALALECLGREELIPVLDKTSSTLTDDEKQEVNSLLRCYNFVENEVALDYCPLKKEETVKVQNDKLYYTRLSKTPARIRKVVSGGELVRFSEYPDHILFGDGWQDTVNVAYNYLPTGKTALTQSAEVADGQVSARLIALGVTAQYFLVNGETGRAALWDKKYRDALRAKNLLRKAVTIRSRRWV